MLLAFCTLLVLLSSAAYASVIFSGEVRFETSDATVIADEDTSFDGGGLEEVEVHEEGLKFNREWFNVSTDSGDGELYLDIYQISEGDPMVEISPLTEDDYSFDLQTEGTELQTWSEEMRVETSDGEVLKVYEDDPDQISWSYEPDSPISFRVFPDGLFVMISWEHDGEATTGYQVYRNTTSNPSEDITTEDWEFAEASDIEVGETEYVVRDDAFNEQDIGEQYCYRVTAIGAGLESDPAPETPEEACISMEGEE